MKSANANLSSQRTVTAASPSLLAVAMALSMAGCEKPAPAPLPPPVVKVLEVVASGAPLSTEVIGQLDSPQNVQVRARIEAFVDNMLFTEGTEVKKDEMLFQLDKKPFTERLAAANGMLAEARAALNKYEKDVARLKPLAEKRAVPQQDLDNAVASVDIGKAAVLSAQANVESAQLDLGYCDVKAPISGLIGAKQVSIGELVGKGEPTLLATISTLDPIWFYCRVAEAGYLKAETEARRTGKKVGDLPVTLILTDASVHPSRGKVVFIDRAVDPTTATLRVRAEFPNPEKLLRPGMFGRIVVDLGTRPDSVLVPERAVTELQGKNFVWVVGPDNKTSQRPVQVGDQIGEKLLILEGLKPGDRIVLEGLQKVKEGVIVQPEVDKAQDAAPRAPAAPPGQPPRAKASQE
jgi:membrane fusion protein (multidrug efflux system)